MLHMWFWIYSLFFFFNSCVIVFCFVCICLHNYVMHNYVLVCVYICVLVPVYACITMQKILSYVPICLMQVRGLARGLVLTKPLNKALTLLRFLSLSSYLSIYLHISLVPPTLYIHTLKIMTSNQTPEMYKLTTPLPKQMPLYQSG